MSINTPGFLEKQVERLETFKKDENPKMNVVKEEIKQPTIIENGLNDAVKELANKGNQSLAESVQPKKEEAQKTEGEGEIIEKEVPKLERVDLDKNKSKKEVKKEEIDSETKNHLDWLKEDDEKEIKKKEENPDYEKEVNTYKSKVKEYEGILNDDYVKAIVEFRKNGGTDLTELNKQLGFIDTSKITIEDFYNQKALDAGLKGDELKEAVDESIERYNSLPKLDQKEILNNFKNGLKNKTEEKLKSFSVQNQTIRQEYENIQKSAFAELEKEVSDKVGKKWRGLLIDEKMGKEILQSAPNYAFPILDENGRIKGYDSKHGVEMAIYAKFGKKLLKAQYDLASISAYDKVIEERNRPSENMTSNQIVVTAPNDIEKVTKEWRDEKRKKGLGLGRSK